MYKRQGHIDAKANKYIHYAVDGARRMQRLVSDLLVYSRVESQAKKFVLTDPETVLQWVLKGMEQTIKNSDTQLSYGEMPSVYADDVQLSQVFQNLIGNAIKFRGDQAPTIEIHAAKKGNLCVFSVKDNGIGIEEAYAHRIFQMFQRLHERGQYEGSGIGLAVCRKIVERHGGTIWFESKPGSGSTFFFTLPLKEPK